MPGTGIEPVRPLSREILSLLCLPISPSGLRKAIIPARVSQGRPLQTWAKEKGKVQSALSLLIWSGRRVSNSRPIPWQGIALPTELLPRETNSGGASRSRTDLHGFAIRCITALLSRRAYLTIGHAFDDETKLVLVEIWSGRRVSNSRPIPWQGIALPTELLPREASAHYKGLARPVND